MLRPDLHLRSTLSSLIPLTLRVLALQDFSKQTIRPSKWRPCQHARRGADGALHTVQPWVHVLCFLSQLVQVGLLVLYLPWVQFDCIGLSN